MHLHPTAAAAGVALVILDTTDSTNRDALARARDGAAGPLWIVAATQTAGRGRQGRAWTSERGNLFATLLLVAPCAPHDAPQLSFVTALAVHDALSVLAPEMASRLALKWPNDVLYDGAKLCGILIEGEGNAVAIGIGVNCVSHPDGTAYPATDMRARGADASAADVLAALSATMATRLAQWDRGAGFSAVRQAWLARAGGVGDIVQVRLVGQELSGRFESLDSDGRLILRLPDGETTAISAGDVFPFDTAVATEPA